MDRCLRLGIELDILASQPIQELVTRQRAGVREDPSDRSDASGFESVVKAELSVPGGARPDKDRAQQLEQPPQVLCGNDVQRAAHQPGPDDRALLVQRPVEVSHLDAAASRANPQPGGAQHLCLQPAHVSQHLRRFRLSRGGRKALRLRAQPQDERIGKGRASRRRAPPPRRARSFSRDRANGRAPLMRAPCARGPRRESFCR